jgi:hypothetical protein
MIRLIIWLLILCGAYKLCDPPPLWAFLALCAGTGIGGYLMGQIQEMKE